MSECHQQNWFKNMVSGAKCYAYNNFIYKLIMQGRREVVQKDNEHLKYTWENQKVFSLNNNQNTNARRIIRFRKFQGNSISNSNKN
jgi:hypothetical protein